MITIHLICIAIILVFIIDLSGFSETLKSWVSGMITGGMIKTTNYSLRPFTCSLCMTFWMGNLYLLASGSFSLPYITLVCLLAFISATIKDILLLMRDMASKGISQLYKLLKL